MNFQGRNRFFDKGTWKNANKKVWCKNSVFGTVARDFFILIFDVGLIKIFGHSLNYVKQLKT